MSEDEFFTELENLAIRWVFIGRHLRTECADGIMCPITALFKHKTGQHVHECYPIKAAVDMGLDRRLAAALVNASDGHDVYPELKSRLYKVCKLDACQQTTV